MDTAILVVSCDRYHDLWRPFFQCFFRYWPDCPFKIYLITGNENYLDDRVVTIRCGSDIDYSTNLINALDDVPETSLIFWVEDRLLRKAIDTSNVLHLLRRCKERNADCLKLIPEHPLAYSTSGLDIGLVPPGTAYRISMTIAWWKKASLLCVARRGESAWELERNGSRRSDNLDLRIFALTPKWRSSPPFPHTHTLVKGNITRESIPFLRAEGIFADYRQRSPESLKSWLYRQLYYAFFRPVWTLRHHQLLTKASKTFPSN